MTRGPFKLPTKLILSSAVCPARRENEPSFLHCEKCNLVDALGNGDMLHSFLITTDAPGHRVAGWVGVAFPCNATGVLFP